MECKADDFTMSKVINNRVIFYPPLFCIVSEAIQKIILDDRWRKDIRKIAIFGTGKFRFFDYIKKLYNLRQVLIVDKNVPLLRKDMERLRVGPKDVLCRRLEPLEVNVYGGRISEPDAALIGTDFVVVLDV